MKKNDAKQANVFPKQTNDLAAIFDWGHPDFQHILIPKEQNPDEIDPKNNPVCIKAEGGVDTWAFAFEKKTGTLSAAIGVVDREQVLGVPGNKLLILMKRIKSFAEGEEEKGEFRPVPLQLPQNARIVGVAGIKAAYYAAIAEGGPMTLAERREEVEKELQATLDKESRLKTKISQLTVKAAKGMKELDDLRKELEGAQGDKVMLSYVKAELQALIDEMHRRQRKELPK